MNERSEQPDSGALSLRESVADIARQLEAVLDAADEYAAETRARAEEEASRYLAEKRGAAESLLANHVTNLEQLSKTFSAESDQILESTGAASDQNGASSNDSAAGDGSREEALLKATQMAVAESSRAEIEEALRSDFGIENPQGIVDEVLGET